VTGRYCWSNGFKYAQVDVNGVTEAQFFQDGILCSSSRPTGDGTTYFAPDGTPLGVLVLNADKSDTLTCKGEPSVTVPADCPTFLKGCSYAAGSCQVP
jgi:hypothetical protein